MAKLLKALAWVFGTIAVIVGLLRLTLINWWTIPDDDPRMSASIEPTLSAGDFVILFRRGTPMFTDLVRCHDPEAPGRFVIGRILGEPGDHIMVDAGSLKLNGKTAQIQHSCTPGKVNVTDPSTGNPIELHCDIEELGGTSYMRLHGPTSDSRSAQTTTEVTPGNVFLASDNRYLHDDSRDYQTVPLATCPERIIFRLWGAKGWFDEKKRLTFIR